MGGRSVDRTPGGRDSVQFAQADGTSCLGQDQDKPATARDGSKNCPGDEACCWKYFRTPLSSSQFCSGGHRRRDVVEQNSRRRSVPFACTDSLLLCVQSMEQATTSSVVSTPVSVSSASIAPLPHPQPQPPPRSSGSGASRVSFVESRGSSGSAAKGTGHGASGGPAAPSGAPASRRSVPVGRPNGNPKDTPLASTGRTPNGLPSGKARTGAALSRVTNGANGRLTKQGSSTEAHTASGESGSRSGSH